MLHITSFVLHVMPRVQMTWEEFLLNTPNNSIALDGMVLGGPRFEPLTNHINFDHHDGVVREATMSTAMQVYMAIKGGLMDALRVNGSPQGHIYINDTDQDTALAVWLLYRYTLFEATQSIPHINRLLGITDRLDITGGAFPLNLSDKVVRQHAWVFQPYTDLRKSGMLAYADEMMLRMNIEMVVARLDQFLMGNADENALDTRHEILYDSPVYKIVNEIGGNDARYYLYQHGMNAFIGLVATRPDGRLVYTIGRRSQYIRFPIEILYDDYNAAEGRMRSNGWNGSNIIGGCRNHGSSLPWNVLRDITNARLKKEGILV